ncbi:2,3,4,5-tetrahydropyridine-2,6-dicarboxylate N-succinyltransferase [Candidatus Johnevansia muelleri]|uniref:2,3,4,5-tetrahydropyridine-2,6-dicarboxylate N-succinyltransferase n=1 Tax=Candidatus Johnevansia muelleri TaxID=1495769 RepID=A0A078KHP0_9GAMM|nr:2,3,4,5-tetrahydropyridine-2,6-dicarboxylate N-succinyltransferase [Candidatus Evansia muelleri]
MLSFGLGIGTKNSSGQLIEIYYPEPILNPNKLLTDTIQKILNFDANKGSIIFSPKDCIKVAKNFYSIGENNQAKIIEYFAKSKRPIIATFIIKDIPPINIAEVYLKLHLISHRIVKPNSINLKNMFSQLKNIAWTNEGAIDVDEINIYQLKARLEGRTLSVNCVDKFPKMTDYVVPKGIRIADTARVRLGAYIGEGTTIMHEGFCNFNAGTEGPAMIEGRISAGVLIGKNTDIGGGASTLGTLSGGGNIIIYIGQNCLIGANAGCGISLGDRCTIESGLYITPSAKIVILDKNNKFVKIVAARELSNKSDLLFIRNSIKGRIECRINKSYIMLNEELHKNK